VAQFPPFPPQTILSPPHSEHQYKLIEFKPKTPKTPESYLKVAELCTNRVAVNVFEKVHRLLHSALVGWAVENSKSSYDVIVEKTVFLRREFSQVSKQLKLFQSSFRTEKYLRGFRATGLIAACLCACSLKADTSR
jgi:hypothetical protein